jgi:cell division protein FtsB
MIIGWRVAILLGLGLINVVLFWRMVWGPTGLVQYRELKAHYAQLEAKVAELDKGNMSLSKEIRLLQSDNTYIEKMIRQRLHYVRDDEILYLFSDPATGAKSNDGKD